MNSPEKASASEKALELQSGNRKMWETHVDELYALIGAHDNDFLTLAGSGAEAIAHLYHTLFFDYITQTGRNHILTTNAEESFISRSLRRFEGGHIVCKEAKVNSKGLITKESIAAGLSPRTALVSLSFASSLTGVIHPLWDIAELCHEKGVFLHVDVTPVLGKLFFRFQDLPIDYLTFDGRAIGAPLGGALFSKKEMPKLAPFSPLLLEMLGKGASTLKETTLEEIRLRDLFEERLRDGIQGAFPLFSLSDRLPDLSAIAFPGVHAEALHFLLEQKGIKARREVGEGKRLEEILQLSGIDGMTAASALSFQGFATQQEVEERVAVIRECVEHLRTVSGVLPL